MSGGETPREPGPAAFDAGTDLTDLLEGFDSWLRRQLPLDATLPDPFDGPDLSTLLREFIALRQEINLLTRATRTQQEQNADTLRELATALETSRQTASHLVPDEAAQLNLKQLVEVRDALSRAEREMQRASSTLEVALTEVAATDPEEQPWPEPPPLPVVPWYLRWCGMRGPDLTAWQEFARVIETRQAESRQRREAAKLARQTVLTRVRQIVTSLLEGYAMSSLRVDRLVQAHNLEPIPTAGQRFDPEQMEALETVPGTGKPAGEVIEEVRRGYTQRGRIFRFALVRVARDG